MTAVNARIARPTAVPVGERPIEGGMELALDAEAAWRRIQNSIQVTTPAASSIVRPSKICSYGASRARRPSRTGRRRRPRLTPTAATVPAQIRPKWRSVPGPGEVGEDDAHDQRRLDALAEAGQEAAGEGPDIHGGEAPSGAGWAGGAGRPAGRERWSGASCYVRAQPSSSGVDTWYAGYVDAEQLARRCHGGRAISGALGYRGPMAAIGSVLAVLHAWVAVAGAVVAVLLAVVGLLDGAGIGRARRWLDRLAAILFVAMVAAVLLGPRDRRRRRNAVESPALPAGCDRGADRAGPSSRGDPETVDPRRLVDGGRCGGDVARVAEPLATGS